MPPKRQIDDRQLDLPAPEFRVPRVVIPAIRIPQPDGSILFKPGKPVIEAEEIGTFEFAKRTGISQRHVETLCEEGHLQCRRASTKPRSKYLIPVSEVDRYRALEP